MATMPLRLDLAEAISKNAAVWISGAGRPKAQVFPR
jgi:hypothetical protein